MAGGHARPVLCLTAAELTLDNGIDAGRAELDRAASAALRQECAT